jgi:hypothetical protein
VEPTYFGHSIGHWDGDTLVVDTVGYNENFWMNRDGMPHTDQLHTIERIRRPDFDTLDYTVTVDDPGAYTAEWTSGYTLGWEKGELFEYMCQENNLSPESMEGEHLFSPIAPARSQHLASGPAPRTSHLAPRTRAPDGHSTSYAIRPPTTVMIERIFFSPSSGTAK